VSAGHSNEEKVMKREELQVDAARFVERAEQAGWGWQAQCVLWGVSAKPVPQDIEAWRALPMQAVPYGVLAPRLDGGMRLAAVDALTDVDGVRAGGAVLLAMAKHIFLPQVPTEHAARQPTEALLAALADYVFGGAHAEHYLGEAFRYRSRFGTSMTAIGDDPSYEHLFEAMPADGLDCALGLGHWDLAGHWRSFGRHLAKQGADWQALEALYEAARETELVSEDEAGDDEAHAGLEAMIEVQQDGYVDRALSAHDATLRALVDELLDTVCNTRVAQA